MNNIMKTNKGSMKTLRNKKRELIILEQAVNSINGWDWERDHLETKVENLRSSLFDVIRVIKSILEETKDS